MNHNDRVVKVPPQEHNAAQNSFLENEEQKPKTIAIFDDAQMHKKQKEENR